MNTLYRLTISASDLHDLIGSDHLVIVDCRTSLTDAHYGKLSYAEGHLPGARFADLEKDLSQHTDAALGRHPLPESESFLMFVRSLGISNDSQVVVYDDVSGAIAGRLWWMLSRWMNHEAVAVLDGGFAHWQDKGYPITRRVRGPKLGTFQAEANDRAWVQTHELVEMLANNAVTVVDARSPERFAGKEEPIDPVAGHIPEAVNAFLGENLENGVYASDKALKNRFSSIVSDAGGADQVVHSCGSGVSAVHNMIAMEKAGFAGSRLYVGSWSEWIRDRERPIATST
ncbi:sulfurtransferase [bacterium]|jgi:thiosulfate/3-mercaptopyruvate sulfurtransferase|nr:sulfurtransferase [Verrucomicrobiales bacterium]MDB4507777.1 sulfurtransferase [bacterium]MDF1788513.1 sulfurtransferase [Verrucomicrobiales bacterium]